MKSTNHPALYVKSFKSESTLYMFESYHLIAVPGWMGEEGSMREVFGRVSLAYNSLDLSRAYPAHIGSS